MVTYLCSNLARNSVGDGELCDGTHIDIRLCRFTGVLFAAWAVGGSVSAVIILCSDSFYSTAS
jgi:hypothetical protein